MKEQVGNIQALMIMVMVILTMMRMTEIIITLVIMLMDQMGKLVAFLSSFVRGNAVEPEVGHVGHVGHGKSWGPCGFALFNCCHPIYVD